MPLKQWMLPSRGREETTGNMKVGVRRELWSMLQKLLREKDLGGNKDGGILEAVQSENRPLQRILSCAPRQYSKPPSSQNLPARETTFIPYNRRHTLQESYYLLNVAVHDYCPHPQEQFDATEWLADVQFTISYFLRNTSELQLLSKSVFSASQYSQHPKLEITAERLHSVLHNILWNWMKGFTKCNFLSRTFSEIYYSSLRFRVWVQTKQEITRSKKLFQLQLLLRENHCFLLLYGICNKFINSKYVWIN